MTEPNIRDNSNHLPVSIGLHITEREPGKPVYNLPAEDSAVLTHAEKDFRAFLAGAIGDVVWPTTTNT